MKSSKPRLSHYLKYSFLAILLANLCACALNSFVKIQEDLEKNIQMYNTRFEGKMMDLSAVFVLNDRRAKFLIESQKVKDKILFYDSSILDIQIFQDKTPIKVTSQGPEKDFNRAVVIMRYQLAVLPSNQLKTIVVKQLWVRDEERWVVVPDLRVFFQ
ncbi:MAG: hypothetical protein ACE5E9_03915 [Nitrospinaceae bacterium]